MNNLAHYVRVYDNVFDEETCNKMIELFDKETPITTPNMRKSSHSWDQDYRSFMELDIARQDTYKEIVPSYYARVRQVYDHYKSVVDSSFFPQQFAFEDARLKRYEANDHDQFGWHIDVGDKASSSRYLVMFAYLNDVEEGGETEFQSDFEFTVKPVRGRMVVFPPMWMFAHRGKKPISGPKYILSTYLHYV